MKVLVFGLGALGTVYSCLLKNKGHYVAGIDYPAVAEAIRRDGVKVNGIWGKHEARLDQVVTSLDELQGQDFGLTILSIKAYETASVAEKLQSIIHPPGYLLLAQNGYGNFEAATRFINPESVILGRVIFGAETINPGFSKVTVIADDVILGSPAGLIDSAILEQFAVMFRQAGIPTRASADIMQYVWGKIIYNSALNPLGAILEVNYGKLAEMESSRELMDQIIEEIFAVLNAARQSTLWPDARAYKEAFYGQLVPSTAGHHASMLQDIQRGRRTEIDALNGAIVKLGEQYGVDTPVNRVVAAVLKAKEAMFLSS